MFEKRWRADHVDEQWVAALKEELADSRIMLELLVWSFGVDLDEEDQRVMDTKLRGRWPEAFE